MGAGQLPAGGVRGGFLVDTGRARAVESRTGARDGQNPRVNDEHDTHDLPGPSLWPIGFAIGVACVLIGLVISIPVLIVGAVVALVFGFLWVRDLFVSRPVTAAAAGLPDVAPVATEADLGDNVDRATFLSLATIGVSGLIGAGRDAARPRLRRAAVVHGRGRRHVRRRPRPDLELSRGPVRDRHVPGEPGAGRGLAAHRVHPQQRPHRRRRAELHHDLQPLRHTSAAPSSRTGRSTRRRRRTSTASSSGRCSRRASAAPATAASTTRRATGCAGPPVRSLDRYEFSIKDGNLVLGRLFSVGTVQGVGASAKIMKYYKAYPGVHVDGIERWLYPIPTPGSTS